MNHFFYKILLSCLFLASATGAFAQITANFNVLNANPCTGIVIPFPATVSSVHPITSAKWDYGDGVIQFVSLPTNSYSTGHAYTQAGTYTVKLELTDAMGNVETVTKLNAVTINPSPNVDFTLSPSAGCQPTDVQFNFVTTSTVTGGWTWTWAFASDSTCFSGNTQDTVVRTNGNPFTYSLPADGVYDVALTVENQLNCKTTTTKQDIFEVFPKPVADFSYQILAGCTPGADVVFSSTSTLPCGATPLYRWNFGDGLSGNTTLASVTHFYPSAGTYTVQLIVEDGTANGCSDTIVQTMVIPASPTLTAMASTMSACQGDNIQFSGITTGNVSAWHWDFGNGDTSNLQNPNYAFQNIGCYNISLSVTIDTCGLTTTLDTCLQINLVPTGAFSSLDAFESCDAPYSMTFTSSVVGTLSPTYHWDFGDGATDSTANATHTWTSAGYFPINFFVTTPAGCASPVQRDTVLVDSILVGFSGSDTVGCVPLTVQFTDFSTSLNDITAWAWDFGDGNTSTLQNPTHTYTTTGNYSVSLTVTNAVNCSKTLTLTDYIQLGTLPVFNVSVSNNTPCVGEPISFINNSNPNQTNWTWFNGLTTSNGFAPADTAFSAAGSYDVWVSATVNGCVDTLFLDDFINIPLVTADFSSDGDCDIDPLLVHFTNNSDGISYQWNFGTGNPADVSTAAEPSFSFPSIAIYEVTLIATASNGCTDTFSRTVSLLLPVADFGWTTDSVPCVAADFPVTFTNASSNYQDCEWIADGSAFVLGTSELNCLPVMAFDSAGDYSVQLVVTAANGCTDTLTQDICVTDIEAIGAIDTASGNGNTINEVIQFTNNGISGIGGTGEGCVIQINPLTGDTIYINRIDGSFVDCNAIFETYTGCIPLTVNFTDSSTAYPDTIVSWHWNFGDGNTSTLQHPTHTYQNASGAFAYLVTLTVSNSFGVIKTDTIPTLIRPTNPIADFVFSNDTVCSNQPLQALSRASGFGLTYNWQFNGSSSTDASPIFNFPNEGSFPVCVTVTDRNGCDSTHCDTVVVIDPVANFAADTTYSDCATLAVQFSDSSLNAVSYLWQFSNTDFSTAQNPSYTYSGTGFYDVSLIATGVSGCNDTLLIQNFVRIDGPLVTNYSVSPEDSCVQHTVRFNVKGENIAQVRVDFGNGTDTVFTTNPAVLLDTTIFYTYLKDSVYTPTLYVEDALTCERIFTFNTITTTDPKADFSISSTIGCVPLNIVLNASASKYANQYEWSAPGASMIGQGTATPVLQYANQGYYSDIQLVITDVNGCRDTLIFSDTITAASVTAGFTEDNLTGCFPLTVNFADTSTAFPDNITTRTWQFINGNTSNSINPTFIYNDPARANLNNLARITVVSSLGCQAVVSKQVLPTLPVANFTTDTFYCTGQNVDYTNLSTGLGLSYNWNFGDGNTSNATNPNHFYAAEDTFKVILTTTDQNGCFDRDTLERIIVANPLANFTASSQYLPCPPDSIQYTDLSLNAISWNWTFEGSNPTGNTQQNPAIGYLNPGFFDVRLIVTSASGCRDTLLQSNFLEVSGPFGTLDLTPKQGCTDLAVDYEIPLFNTANIFVDRGDNSAPTFLVNPPDTFSLTHIYTQRGTYTPTVYIQDAAGCQRVLTDGNVVVTDPEPIFTLSQDTFCLPATITTTNNSLDVANYQWFNSDGTRSNNSATPSFTFNATDTGFHQIRLIVRDINGCRDTLTQTVLATNIFVTAASDVQNGCRPLDVQFSSNSVSFANNTNSWFWNFGGNEGLSNLPNPIHTYANVGIYTPTLLVVSDLGCSRQITLPTIRTTFPNVSFTKSLNTACTEQTINFTNNSNGQNLSYAWNMGNGQTFSTANVSYAFPTEGVFNVCLTATDLNGCDSTYCQNVTIENPVADFSTDALFRACPPATFQMNDLSANATSWAWTFGDGNTSTAQNPSNIYTETGLYDVQLIVTGVSGCRDTSQVTVLEVGGPVGNFTFTPKQGCADVTATFNGNVTANTIDFYIWNFADGTIDTVVSNLNNNTISHTYTVAGTYFPTLTLQDAVGCQFVTDLDSIEVDTLQFDFFANDTLFCESGNLTFTPYIASSSPIDSVLWTFNGAIIPTSTAMIPTVAYDTVGDFTVSLTVFSNHCSKTVTKTNYIKAAPIPNNSFTTAPTVGCNPTTVFFNDATTLANGNLVSWAWDFGDGGVDSTQNTANSYQTVGQFAVTLTTVSNHGCTDTLVLNNLVTINPIPQPIFGVDSLVCSGQNLTFVNNSQGNNLTYLWNFGDGNTATDAQPTHNYAAEGNYNVCLTVTDVNGCDSTTCQTVLVADPLAGFASDKQYLACPPDSVQFLNASANDVSWFWTFGDGDSSVLQNPTHTYLTTGFYDVQLVVTNISGCRDTLLQTNFIEVGGPVGDFTFTPKQGCADVTATFNGNVTANTIDFYIWNFADGTIDTVVSNLNNNTISHTYTVAGTYFPTLTLQDAVGCQFVTDLDSIEVDTLQFDFFANDTLFCESGNLTFTPYIASSSPIDSVLWTFNGAIIPTSTAMMPTVAYDTVGDFTVSLTVFSNHCFKTVTKTNYIKAAPIPNNSFTTAPTVGCNPTTVFFNDATTLANGNLVSWAWDFGDGSVDSVQNVTHSYQTVGQFAVTLTTVSNHGCANTLVLNNLVTINPIPQPIFGVDSLVCSGQNLTFVNNSQGNNLTYLWNFGDGNTATDAQPTHNYAAEGNYNVCLTVTDVNGCDSTTCQTVLVADPLAGFASDKQYLACPPDSVQFLNASANDVSWLWTFGDGDSSVLQNPTHTYLTTGFYDVQLVVTNISGCRDTLLQTNFIEVGGPVGNFTFTPKQGCADVTATFNGNVTANNVDFYIWNFADGTIDTVVSNQNNNTVSHTYTVAGTYFPTLTLQDAVGCQFVTDLDSIEVDTLQFDFFANDTLLCESGNLTFTPYIASSSPIDSVLWTFNGAIIPTSTAMMPTVAYDTVGDFTVSLTVFSNHCSKTVTKTNYIKAAPIPTAYFQTLTNPFCSEQAISFVDASTIFSGGVVSWAWNFGDASPTNTLQNPLHTFADSGSYNVNLLVTSEHGCSDDTTMTIFINKTPEPSAAATPILCIGESTELIPSGGAAYEWYLGGSLICDTCSTITVAPIVTTTYTLVAISAVGCRDTISAIVEVLPFSVPPLVVSNDTTICKGDVAQLFASGGYNVTQYVWDNAAAGLSCYTHCTNPFASPTTTTTYYVTLTWDGGCNKTDSVTVTVIDDAANILGNDRTICLGDAVPLTLQTGTNAVWSPSEGLSCIFCDNPVASPNVTTTYAVKVNTLNGCTIRDTITVNVQTPAMISAGEDATICNNTTIELQGMAVGTFSWVSNPTLGDATILNPIAAPTVTTNYVLNVQNDLCFQTDTVQITVAEKVDINIDDVEICADEPLLLDIQGYAETFTFSPDSGIVSNAPFILLPQTTTTYTVIGEIPACEPDTTVFTITVNPIPDIGLQPIMNVFKNSVTPLPIDAPNSSYIYAWIPSEQLSCSDCYNPFFIADTSFEALTIYANLSTTAGCSFTDSIRVIMRESCNENLVALPTAFTPNNDGQNDVFRVRPLGVSDIEVFRVFNRWGEQLFETSRIEDGWDGTYRGKTVEQGVYVYYVQAICPLTNEIQTIKGEVFLHF